MALKDIRFLGGPPAAGLEVVRSWEAREACWCAYSCAGCLVIVAPAGRRMSNGEPIFRKQWIPGRPVLLSPEDEADYFDGLRQAKLAITQHLREVGER